MSNVLKVNYKSKADLISSFDAKMTEINDSITAINNHMDKMSDSWEGSIYNIFKEKVNQVFINKDAISTSMESFKDVLQKSFESYEITDSKLGNTISKHN